MEKSTRPARPVLIRRSDEAFLSSDYPPDGIIKQAKSTVHKFERRQIFESVKLKIFDGEFEEAAWWPGSRAEAASRFINKHFIPAHTADILSPSTQSLSPLSVSTAKTFQLLTDSLSRYQLLHRGERRGEN